MPHIPEPPVSDDDTKPSITVRPPELDERIKQQTQSSRWPGWLSLAGAALFTVATLVVLLLPGEQPAPEQQNLTPDDMAAPTTVVEAPAENPTTTLPTIAPTVDVVRSQPVQDSAPPVVEPSRLNALLNAPVRQDDDSVFARVVYEPFTLASDRPRTEFIDYEVQQGDTIDNIARRFGLEKESLAWCNSRSIVLVIRPGDIVRVPPVNGACHTVLGTREETPRSIVQRYKLDDPFVIIDSPYNPDLYGVGPDDILPGGIRVFIPGGQGEAITWNPGYETETDSGGNLVRATFAPGQPGSCGRVDTGSGTAWGHPLPGGTWVRGFYTGHTGVDLAAPVGTAIYAANSGNVMFSGFSKWGYGNAVVLAHGPFSTLYGHMSQINVGCGQFVSVGQVVGLVGNTGNSSGPHLHFEIRYNDEATDPTQTIGF